MDRIVQQIEPFLSSACYIVQQSARYAFLTVLPFICLNGILVSLFLLKSLFFKPKFVENRHQTIAIDPRQKTAELDVNQMETCIDTSKGNNNAGSNLKANEPKTLHSAVSRIEQLYSSESYDSVEYIAPSNEKIKFNEKLGSGFVGVLFKLAAQKQQGTDSRGRQLLPPMAKCAKLIDMKSLRQIIEELNYVPGTLSQKIRLTNLFRSSTLGANFLVKYLANYHKFLDFAQKLEVPNSKSQSYLPHPNVLYYEQVLINDGNCIRPQNCHKKTFKPLAKVERQQLPALVMLIMAQAKMNLRSVIINEWHNLVPANITVEWGRQIGIGLAHLHRIGVSHLNLKPENILLFEANSDEEVATNIPLEQRYILKLSDCATALLLPTASKVLSQSHETSLFEMSPPFSDKFDKNVDKERYDVHCYAMILLLILVGYEHFGRWFVLPQFPTGLLSPVRYRLMDAILQANRRDVPEVFVDLFKTVFEPNGKDKRVTVQLLLQMAPLKL